MKYRQPYGVVDADASYVNGNPAIGLKGSIIDARAQEETQRELQDFIVKGGITPSYTDLGQVAKAAQTGKITYAVAAGTANALTATLSPAPSVLTEGMIVRVKLSAANTGPVTLDLNGTGAAAVVANAHGEALPAGAFAADATVDLIWDGARWRVTSYTFDPYLIETAITRTVHGPGADFADLHAAILWLSRYRITASGSVLISLAAGKHTYAESVDLDHPNGDRITVQGAALLGGVPSAATFPVTGDRATDRATHLTNLRAIYATELAFSDGDGLRGNGSTIRLDRLLVTGNRVGGANTAGGVFTGGHVRIGTVSFHGHGGYGVSIQQGIMTIETVLTSGGNVGTGFGVSDSSGVLYAGAIHLPANDTHGLYAISSHVRSYQSGVFHARENGGDGAQIYASTFSFISGSVFSNNGVRGIYGDQAQIAGTGSTLSSNGGADVAAVASRVSIPSCAFGGTSPIQAQASNMTFIGVAGGSGLTTTSPALNTLGNNDALIATT